MKFFPLLLLALFISVPLGAQNEGVEIPTEVAEAPYEVGDLVSEQGYYIERGEDEPRINFRIVDNRLRIYWIDGNGLIAEPESETATVRFTGSVRGRAYHRLSLLPTGGGLGAAGIMTPPHLYNVILVFPADEGAEPVSYNFRYSPSMDVEVDPTVDGDS
ncbi:hypothetical protein SH580_09765 [Coraliomargarita algicola]|uniref:Uncharacterized protein n=1 Tax=Coraliomargarita algicola TaxID=3092156 RepID=A0ABZ0RP58_9BACT|nr:hypothetical protein [Coraliomargarita sp. J2-16]WPJ97995.1 hypothetical protein SH580_09765 [Coraliomargarita sp. J2-16]